MPDLSQIAKYLPGTVEYPNAATNPDDTTFARARMNELYQPESVASSALQDYMAGRPQPEDYPASRMQKVGALLAGLGTGGPTGHWGGVPVGYQMDPGKAFATTSGILNAPYERAESEYETGLKPMEFAATDEQRRNREAREFATQSVGKELQEREIGRKTAADKAREEQGQERIEISRKRAEAYDFHQRHPNYKGWIDNDGKVVYVNQQDPTDIIHTDVDTGKMNDFDKINMGIQGHLSEIAARTKGAKELEEQKQTGRMEVRTTPGAGTNKPGTTPTNRPDTANQLKIRQYQTAQQIANEDPENAKYLEFAPGNNFRMVMPSHWGLTTGDKKKYDDIYNRIYGSSKENKPAVTPPKNAGPPKKEEETVQVRAKGTTKILGTIPKSQAGRLNTDKYEVVPAGK